MLSFRPLIGVAAVLAILALPGATASAQGVTTGALTGTVTDESGQPVEGAQVQLRHPSTGLNVGASTRSNGLYVIQGVAPGSGFTVTVRRIGYGMTTRTGIVVVLSQTRREDFVLKREAAQLAEVTVTGVTDPVFNASKTGTTSTISDSALSRLPTLNRNFADFVQLVPQVSTTTGFLSGGGVNLRQNAIQIDGAQSGDAFGLGTTGQPGSQANAKSIPLDAVKEYQVLLSPFDVKQGNFGGLLINAVTKSGTNEFHGSVFGYTRDQKLTRSQPYLNDYTQQQFGGSIGGPIMKDKLFFFLSGEAQRLKTPAGGSYIGAPDAYVSQASIDQVNNILSTQYGFTEAGNGDRIQRENPNRNLFARVDAYLPMSTRLVVRHNFAGADNTNFGRGNPTTTVPSFNLSSNRYEFSSKTNSSVVELLTNLQSGTYNEFFVNYSTTKDFRTVPARFPQLTINGIPRTDVTGTARFVLGTESSSQGNSLDQRTFEITDNLTIPVGAHSITVGAKGAFYKSINLFASNSLGSFTFNDLASLQSGTASNYVISSPAPTDPYNGIATIKANQYGAYVQDQWTVTPALTLTAGIRWDKPDFQNLPPENDIVFQQYKRHTSSVPTQAQWSPRFGFNWDVTGDQRNQLRGGIGSFSGSVPFVYLSNAFGNSGLSGFSVLTCNGTIPSATATTSLQVPAFNQQNINTPPTKCADFTRANGQVVPGAAIAGPASSANVATIDPDFKYPKYLKGSLGFDRRFNNGFIGTLEGLYSRSQNNAFYQNLALAGPTGQTDARGRVLYGTLTATGGTPATIGNRQQVLDVTNSSGDYTWSTTAQLQKQFSNNFEGSAAYTFQQARDVVSVTSSTQGSNFRYQRSVSGRLDDMTVTKSKYDQPHRLIATGSYRLKTMTDISVIYTGNSGAPYDYVYGVGTGTGSGDANGDGQSQNDLIYVPKNANDQTEMLFTGFNGATTGLPAGSTAAQAMANAATMASAFEAFISNTPCLNDARGTILTRNACRNPWVNQFDISIAQSLDRLKLGGVQVRLDVVNFGNLLNKDWGKQAFSDQNATCGQICSATTIVTQQGNRLPVGITTNSPLAQGIYTFVPTFEAFTANNAASNYRMQLSMRYSF